MRALLMPVVLVCGCSDMATFDATKWRDADLTGRARADMFPDLARRYHLVGMPRDQVVALLGIPAASDKWRGADMIYVLGNDGSMFPIDNEWLFIKLDRNGRVVSYWRGTD